MKYLGLSEKEIKQIINNIHPDGWVIKKSQDGKRETKEPSEEQILAVKKHLENLYALEKRKAYLSQLIERLRPEVEGGKIERRA